MKDTTEARERLAEAVEQMASSEGFAALLRARALFPSYSLNNVCLIAAQAPHATKICGFRSWKALGRYVKRGERGIRILAPCRVKVGETESDEGTRATFRVVGFRAVSVFDISQTEGEPLPELECRALEGDVERMLIAAAHHGAEIGLCGTCMTARGITDEMISGSARRSSLDEATDWVLWADKTITF